MYYWNCGAPHSHLENHHCRTYHRCTWHHTIKMAKKNKMKQIENDHDLYDDEEPDFSDPEDYVDTVTDEGKSDKCR